MKTVCRSIKRVALGVGMALLCAGAVLCGAVLVRGYALYRSALAQASVAEKITEVQQKSGYTPLVQFPPAYLHAVVAVEDHRFYSHHGIDLLAIGRAFVNDLRAGYFKEGGSTITQQLAKNWYFTQEKTFTRKIAELFMAREIESQCSKRQILELYINSIYFGSGYTCAADAARGYFGKGPSQLNAYECTLLAGIPNAPSAYAPTVDPQLAAQRQKQVLAQMVKWHYLTPEQAAAVLTQQPAFLLPCHKKAAPAFCPCGAAPECLQKTG